ncbi:MFS transporter, partial [Macrococcus caseolyticus]
ADEFDTTVSKINLTATVYSIFQGVSPILWGSLSDSWGRRPVYFCCALIYMAANIALAKSNSYSQLLGLRILQAFGGASTVTLVGGTIGDFSTRSTRGGLIGISTGISQLGNCFGPLIGSGIETQFNSWRAIFWALAIFAGIIFIIIFFFLPETNRHVVGNGSRAPLPGPLYILSRSPYAMVRRWKTVLPKKPSDPTYEDEWILPPKKIHWFRWAQLFF